MSNSNLFSFNLRQGNTVFIQEDISIRIQMLNKNITFCIKPIIDPTNKNSTIAVYDCNRIFLSSRKIGYNSTCCTPHQIAVLIHFMGKNIPHTVPGVRPNKYGFTLISRCYSSVPFNMDTLADWSAIFGVEPACE